MNISCTKLQQSWPRNLEQRGGNSLTPLSMTVTELIFIRLVPACQFLERNVTLDSTKIKQMVWSQMGEQGLSPHKGLFFFIYLFWKELLKKKFLQQIK
jgi:hypothetical protein